MSLNKKILFSTIIIIIFIVAIFVGAFFYLPEEQIPSDISQKTDKEKCLEDVAQMTDQELINEVKNLKDPYGETGIVGSDGIPKDRMSWAQNQMSRYLICKLRINSNNEDVYNRAKKFIDESGFEEEYEDNKQIYLSKLERARSVPVENSFNIQLALGDLDEICPNVLPGLCLEEIANFNVEQMRDNIEDCENICDLINQYSDNREKLEEIILNNKEWIEEIYDKQYRFRSAMAYRFDGQNSAVKICDNIKTNKREECLEWVDFLEKENIRIEECNDVFENLKYLICQLPID
jgi:hypothetical protein